MVGTVARTHGGKIDGGASGVKEGEAHLIQVPHFLRLEASHSLNISRRGVSTTKDCLGFWTEPEDFAKWEFQVTKPGRYKVAVIHGCGGGNHGSEVEVKQRVAGFGGVRLSGVSGVLRNEFRAPGGALRRNAQPVEKRPG